jgi:hypothetical protein
MRRNINGILIAAALVCIAHSGCKTREGVVTKLDQLYDVYRSQEYEAARNALLSTEKIFTEEASPTIRDKGFWRCYSRLYVLELKHGDSDRAAIAFQKAKYWYLVKLESDGCDPEKVRMKMDLFTPDNCREWSEKFDAGMRERDATLKRLGLTNIP